MKKILFIITMISSVFFASCNKYSKDTRLAVEDGKSVVERYGFLQVKDGILCSQDGNPVQLRGMSSHGLQWYGKYANQDVIDWLRNDWNCQVWRAAMYLTEGGYLNNKVIKLRVIDSIEACLKAGIYVMVDWHVLGNGDPSTTTDQAVEFFEEIASKYGQYPNIIYEVCNEPNGENVTWKEKILPHAQKCVDAIRKYDQKNIIIAGTPYWSSCPNHVIGNMVKDKNTMYTLHFYAGSHGAQNKKNLVKAVKAGIPVFCTEWGTTEASGGGGVYIKETVSWLKLLEKYNISWVNWSVNNKGEESGILKFNKDRNAKGGWTEDDLSESGIFVRKVLRNEYTLK